MGFRDFTDMQLGLMKLKLLAAFAALSITAFGQTNNNTAAAKPEPAPAVTVPTAPPAISTAKLWRLVAQTQGLRQQLDATDLGKQLKEVDAELQAEQARLSGLCGANAVLGYDQDKNSPTYKDIVCLAKPPEAAAAKPDAPTKGK